MCWLLVMVLVLVLVLVIVVVMVPDDGFSGGLCCPVQGGCPLKPCWKPGSVIACFASQETRDMLCRGRTLCMMDAWPCLSAPQRYPV